MCVSTDYWHLFCACCEGWPKNNEEDDMVAICPMGDDGYFLWDVTSRKLEQQYLAKCVKEVQRIKDKLTEFMYERKKAEIDGKDPTYQRRV